MPPCLLIWLDDYTEFCHCLDSESIFQTICCTDAGDTTRKTVALCNGFHRSHPNQLVPMAVGGAYGSWIMESGNLDPAARFRIRLVNWRDATSKAAFKEYVFPPPALWVAMSDNLVILKRCDSREEAQSFIYKSGYVGELSKFIRQDPAKDPHLSPSKLDRLHECNP